MNQDALRLIICEHERVFIQTPFSMNAVVQERKVEKVGQASRWKPMAEPTPEMIASHQKCTMMTNTLTIVPFPSFLGSGRCSVVHSGELPYISPAICWLVSLSIGKSLQVFIYVLQY